MEQRIAVNTSICKQAAYRPTCHLYTTHNNDRAADISSIRRSRIPLFRKNINNMIPRSKAHIWTACSPICEPGSRVSFIRTPLDPNIIIWKSSLLPMVAPIGEILGKKFIKSLSLPVSKDHSCRLFRNAYGISVHFRRVPAVDDRIVVESLLLKILCICLESGKMDFKGRNDA